MKLKSYTVSNSSPSSSTPDHLLIILLVPTYLSWPTSLVALTCKILKPPRDPFKDIRINPFAGEQGAGGRGRLERRRR
eukprot:763776-Hanusia_phi.AAC.7